MRPIRRTPLFISSLALAWCVSCGAQSGNSSGGGGSDGSNGAAGGGGGGSAGSSGGSVGGGAVGSVGGGAAGSLGGTSGATGGLAGGQAGAGGGLTGGSAGGLGGGQGGGSLVDLDRDGLDDAFEAHLASAYLPRLAVHPQDSCPLSGLLYRARPHPADSSVILILYVFLFQNDCGLRGHLGDNEGFAITVNPAKPPPLGLTAMRAIAHQGTLCQRVSTCGTCDSLKPCDRPDGGNPVLHFSKDKHGGYALLSSCGGLTCFDSCATGDRTGVPMVNAGEPDAHLVEDLTDGGFITTANGWTEQSLFHFNPWKPAVEFGRAGIVADDLIDPAFTPPACR